MRLVLLFLVIRESSASFSRFLGVFLSLLISLQAKYLVGFATLRELITKCPAKKETWMQLLLELTTREKEQVRILTVAFLGASVFYPNVTSLILAKMFKRQLQRFF